MLRFPKTDLPGGAGTTSVIAGELLDVRGPASTFTPINVWDLQLVHEASLNLPLLRGHTALAVVQSGNAHAANQRVGSGELVLFDRSGGTVPFKAASASRVLILTGEAAPRSRGRTRAVGR